MKKILYVTGSRAEYGIVKRLLAALKNDQDIELTIIATGMHCDEKYGLTYKQIEKDGFVIEQLINININTLTNSDIINSMSVCQQKIWSLFSK